MKASMKINNRQGHQLAVQVQGVKDAPVIMFSNSLGTDHGMWQAQVDTLAQHYQMVFVSNVIQLSAQQRNEARRLTWLIDVFYDYRVKLCASSAVEAAEIYVEGSFAEEFKRTVSRMVEMESTSYLSLPHLSLGNNKN